MSKQSNLQLNLSAYWVLLWASSSPSRSVQACRMVHAVAWLKNKWDRPPCLFHHHGKDMYLRYCCRVSCNLCFSSQLLRHVFFFSCLSACSSMSTGANCSSSRACVLYLTNDLQKWRSCTCMKNICGLGNRLYEKIWLACPLMRCSSIGCGLAGGVLSLIFHWHIITVVWW